MNTRPEGSPARQGPAGASMLDIKDLVVSYGAITALHGVSLRVNQGEIVCLIGPNGAGKSTCLRTISGLLAPRRGGVFFEGRPITARAPHEITAMGIVHAPEGRGVFPNLSVAENLSLGAWTRKDHDAVGKDLEYALSLFPRLRERYRQSAGTLSGGEQQMLAIARAMLARPRLLMLDEPSLGLAPKVVATIFETIASIHKEGTTVLLVEQNARMALNLANRAYVLEAGRMVMEGDAKALAQSKEVQDAYLGVG